MDQSRDGNGAELYRLSNLYSAPAFVKSASKSDLVPDAQLPPAAYADPRNKTYPLHSKAAVWASYAFFQDKKANYRKVDADMVEERILLAGRRLGIADSLAQLKQASERNVPTATEQLPDEDFALVWVDGDKKERHLPMRNSVEVKQAAAYLAKWRSDPRLCFEDRQNIAEKIASKANTLGVNLGEYTELVEKQAGYGACTTNDAVELIRERVQASRRGPGALTELQNGLLKLADILEKNPGQIRDYELRVKLAGNLDAFDRANKLNPLVRDGHLPAVEDVLFRFTREKLASVGGEHVSTTTGNIYRLADVERLKLASVREAIGEDVAEALTSDGLHIHADKAASVIPTLDRGAASVFDGLMEAAGLGSAAKTASAQAIKLENSFLLEVAKNHR